MMNRFEAWMGVSLAFVASILAMGAVIVLLAIFGEREDWPYREQI